MKRAWKITETESDKIPPQERKMSAQTDNYVDFYEARQDGIIKRDPAAFEKLNRVW